MQQQKQPHQRQQQQQQPQQQQHGQPIRTGQFQFGQVDFSRPIKTREETIKLYTEWANHYLEKAGYSRFITDLQNDVRDGRLLVDIINAVANEKVPINVQTKTPVEIVDCCIKILADIGVDITDVTTDGIVSGKLKCVLALFFSLSKHKQKMRSQTKLPIPGAIRPSILPTSVGPTPYALRSKDIEQKSNSESPDGDRRYVTPPSSVQNSLPDIQMSKERVNSSSPAEPKPRVSSLPVFGARTAGQDSSYARRSKIPFAGPTSAGGGSAVGSKLRLQTGTAPALRSVPSAADSPTAEAAGKVNPATKLLHPANGANGKSIRSPRPVLGTGGLAMSGSVPRPSVTCCLGGGAGYSALGGAKSPQSGSKPSLQEGSFGTNDFNQNMRQPVDASANGTSNSQHHHHQYHSYENSQQLPRKPKTRTPRTRPDLVRVSSCSATNPAPAPSSGQPANNLSPTFSPTTPFDSPFRRPAHQDGLPAASTTVAGAAITSASTSITANNSKAPFGYRFVNVQSGGGGGGGCVTSTSATGVPPLRNLPYKTRVSAPMVTTAATGMPMSTESAMPYPYPVVDFIQNPPIYQKHHQNPTAYCLPPRFYVPPHHQYAPLAPPQPAPPPASCIVFLGSTSSANSDSIPSLVRSPRLPTATTTGCHRLAPPADTSMMIASPRQAYPAGLPRVAEHAALPDAPLPPGSSRSSRHHQLPPVVPVAPADPRIVRPPPPSAMEDARVHHRAPQTTTAREQGALRGSRERYSLESSHDDSSLGTDSPPGSPGEINRAVSELEGANPSTWSGREGFDRLSRLEISVASTSAAANATASTTATATPTTASTSAEHPMTDSTPSSAVITAEQGRLDTDLRSASLASVNRFDPTASYAAIAAAADGEDRSVRSECLYASPIHLRKGTRAALTNYFSDTDLVGELGADWMDGCQSLPMMRQSAGATVSDTGGDNGGGEGGYLLHHQRHHRGLPVPATLRTPGAQFPLVANHQAAAAPTMPAAGELRRRQTTPAAVSAASESAGGEDPEAIYGVISHPPYLCRRPSASSSSRGSANLMAPIKLPYDTPHSVGVSKRTVKTPTTISPSGFYQSQAANLKQQLEAEQRKVAELTSQLNTNAYVVSAFEQSLANMAQRLQSLTVSAAQKDSELQELRQLIDSMRQDRSTDSAVSTMASSMHAVETSPTTCSNFQQHEGGGTMGRHGNASPTHSVSIFSTDEPHSKCSDLGENSCHTLPPGSLTPGQCAKKANWLRSSFCKAFKKKGSQTSLLLPPESSKSDSYRWGDGFNSLSRSSQAGGEKLCSPPMDSRFKDSTANTPLNGTACRVLPVSPSNSSTSSSSWSMQGPIAGRRPSQSSSRAVKKTSSIPDEITRKAICELKSPDHHHQQHEKASSEKPLRTGVVVSGDRVTASGLSASDKEIDQLRKELADRETKLTEVQLQALASAHQVDQLRDQMTYMFEELTLLRTENEQLQRLSMQLHSTAGSNKSLPRAADQQLLQLTTAGAGSACGRNCCTNSSGASSVGSSAVPSAITPQLSLNSSSYSHVSPDQ